jgi:glycolate dehydrogenase FAD-binding subunit
MSASGAIALSQLAEIAGESNVIRDPSQLVTYEIDGNSPSAVVCPGSTEEVAEIVKFAGREKLALIPAGARTKLEIGMPPRQYDFALDMTRMDRIAAYDPGDLTLGVEAGITLHRIASTLAEHRQFLPLAVPFMDRATVGGTIASGVDSPLRLSYGTARDFVLGMEFVTGDGVAANSGGRVVKNVSGYDIHKLMIGSLGTLGVITRVNFRTFPLPAMTRTFVVVFRESESACELRNAIARSALRPRSLEILSASSSGAELRHDMELFGSNRWTIIVSFAGDEQVLKRDRREIEVLAKGLGGNSLESIEELSADNEKNATNLVAEFPATTLERCPGAIFKISALPTELADLAGSIQSFEMPWAVMMRGLGVAYLAIMPRDGSEESFSQLKRQCARIFGLAGKPPWRHVVVPWCPPALKREIDIWGPPPADFALMKKLKGVFDPVGILSPGRFIGGI